MWRAEIVTLVLALMASSAVADTRSDLTEQLGSQLDVIGKTIDTISTKLVEADTVRVRRLRAAYRLLHAPLAANATGDDRMAAARRRASARFLVDRDAGERALLVQELARLNDAKQRTTTASAALPAIALPERLSRPVAGVIARRFGTLEHDRSKATLSRRGIDLEVESRASVIAPADGTVRYAGSIRGLDAGVILDHGTYFTVIAKLGDVAVPVGTTVHRGDHLGHAARQRVYLEVRVRIGAGGLPIDPEPLLVAPPTDETR